MTVLAFVGSGWAQSIESRDIGPYAPPMRPPASFPAPPAGMPTTAPSEPTVKSLGTITLSPGEDITHPYVAGEEDDAAAGDLNVNHVAYGEATRHAYEAKDFDEARALYEQAARRGNGQAMYALAGMVERGEGGPRDLEQAMCWYYAAAQKGVKIGRAHV